MKMKRIAIGGTVLLSLLLSFVRADTHLEKDVVEFDSETGDDYDQEKDLYLEETEYDYEEVVGEEATHNIVPFNKHPGVYVLDLDGVLYALDADNGEILWARKVSDKLMKVTEAQPPPKEYNGFGNSTSVQSVVSKPFNKMLVSLDGYILLPRVDGKFNVFQHSIDTIISKDAVTVEVPERGEDMSLLFMGGKKSSFITLDAISGKLSTCDASGMSSSLSDIRVIRVEKSVNCFSNKGYEFWNLTTNTVSLQFSHEVMRHLNEVTSVEELIYSDAFTIQAYDEFGKMMWDRRFPSMLIQSYYANNSTFVLIRNTRSMHSGGTANMDEVRLLDYFRSSSSWTTLYVTRGNGCNSK